MGPLIDAISSASMASIRQFKPGELEMLAWAFSQLNVPHLPWALLQHLRKAPHAGEAQQAVMGPMLAACEDRQLAKGELDLLICLSRSERCAVDAGEIPFASAALEAAALGTAALRMADAGQVVEALAFLGGK